MRHITHYELKNRATGETRTFKDRIRARRAADRADLAYGAICCSVRPVWADSFTTTPAAIAAEHAAEVSSLETLAYAAAAPCSR